MIQKIHPRGEFGSQELGLVSMMQIWQVSSECGPSNLVVLVLAKSSPQNVLQLRFGNADIETANLRKFLTA